jgi:hypothetical protein
MYKIHKPIDCEGDSISFRRITQYAAPELQDVTTQKTTFWNFASTEYWTLVNCKNVFYARHDAWVVTACLLPILDVKISKLYSEAGYIR